MNKIITLENNEKWLVIATVNYKNNSYSYIVKLNEKEDDFLDEYKIITSSNKPIENKEDIEKIKSLLIPIVKNNLNIK